MRPTLIRIWPSLAGAVAHRPRWNAAGGIQRAWTPAAARAVRDDGLAWNGNFWRLVLQSQRSVFGLLVAQICLE